MIIVLSYGLHMVMEVYCYGENMNIMAFRGGLENYMAVMVLKLQWDIPVLCLQRSWVSDLLS